MPTSSASNWFITVSTRSEEDVDLKVLDTLCTVYAQYYVVREEGSDGTHPHFHAALWGDKVETQAAVRKRWIRQLDLEDQGRSVVVKMIDDGNRLIGQYLSKDPNVQVLHSNLPDSLVTSLREIYKKVNDNKKKKKYIVISNLADEIIKHAKATERELRTKEDLCKVVSSMYQSGMRFISGLSRMKSIWVEIQMIQGDVCSDHDIFGFM